MLDILIVTQRGKKMITSSGGKALETKEEAESNNNNSISIDKKHSLKPSSSSTRKWSEYSKNPRIIRVSRSFGGKDRHSKVCTIRGLRDRRIRLSIATAIQLYDLQDKLGVGQPSKVIDWLIDAAKSDIDNLPPLQCPHGFGSQFHHQQQQQQQQMPLNPLDYTTSSASQSSFSPFGFDTVNPTDFSKSGLDQDHHNAMVKYFNWDLDVSLRGKSKEVAVTDDQEEQDHGVSGQVQASTQNFFPVAGIYNTGTYHNWEPSKSSLSTQFGKHGFQAQEEEENSLNNNPNPMLLPLSLPVLPSPHFSFGPIGTPISSINHPASSPPNYVATPLEIRQSRETNHFPLLTSNSSQNFVPTTSRTIGLLAEKHFPFNLEPGFLHHLHNQRVRHPVNDSTTHP